MVTCWASSPAASSLWREQQMHRCCLGLDFKAAQPWDCHPCDSLSTTSYSQKWNVPTAEGCCIPLEQITARLGLILYGQERFHAAHASTKGCWGSQRPKQLHPITSLMLFLYFVCNFPPPHLPCQVAALTANHHPPTWKSSLVASWGRNNNWRIII